MLECKQSQIQQFFQILEQITPNVLIPFVPESNSSETLCACILWPSLVLVGQYLQMLECKQSQISQFSNSRANNSNSSGPIRSIIELIRSLMVTYILTKFGIDFLNICRCQSVNKVRFSNFSKFKDK